jgi:hypothetical protein
MVEHDTGGAADSVRSPHGRSREAVVFVPGLRSRRPGKTKRGVVTRLARSLEMESTNRAITFTVQWHEGAVHDAEGPSRMATILRRDGQDERPVIDCYAFDWAGKLKERWKEHGLLNRTYRVVMSMFNAPSFLRYFRTSGKKNAFGRMQLFLAGCMVVLLALYLCFLAFAVYQATRDTIDQLAGDDTTTTQTSPSPTSSGSKETAKNNEENDKQQGKGDKGQNGAKGGNSGNKSGNSGTNDNAGSADAATETTTAEDQGPTNWQWAALVAAGVALIPKFRRGVMRTGATLGALASYVRVADGQAAIAGEFTTMIERLTEEHPKQQITVIAYSFGSIVTLDALFPTTIGPPHSFDKVVTLVTVGSPYDFVCALRPNWKDGRHHAQSPPQWINIYSTIDLMGSNYRNDTDGPSAQNGLAPVTATPGGPPPPDAVMPNSNEPWDMHIEPRWNNLFEFQGFTCHGMYWGEDDEDDSGVFSLIVQRLYAGTPLLA